MSSLCVPWHGLYSCNEMYTRASTGSNPWPSLLTGQQSVVYLRLASYEKGGSHKSRGDVPKNPNATMLGKLKPPFISRRTAA